MSRTESRRMAFELLYSFEVQKIEKTELNEQLDLYIENNEIIEKKVIEYIRETINGISENEEEISKKISENLTSGWKIERVSKVDITILKLAIYEIIYIKLPYKIVINEAVELAKSFGEDSSPSFVNGILANIVKNL